ncbi:unnamed protein product [Tilletia controversa]|uniref:Uncharacterized protein n=1 Tax=Tilletia caries TaxID=13290 RepID=A0A177VA82_9BASI|nr:hypothetical protein CF336_g3392 [Tilletia laevis]KAE8204810.1 hypothetical protein CF335_g2520 [Tilletia laevis]KAE8262044.1 hypothetical protein A4X03_0g2766 [Tilletia caries]CAD6921458.1 unnamed protein product [Tilletia controversa]
MEPAVAAPAAPQDAATARTTFSDLPIEILTLIARALLPGPPARSTTFPPQANQAKVSTYSKSNSSMHASYRFPSKAHQRNILALALVSRACAAAALPVLYSVIQLRTVSQIRLLAKALRHSTASVVARHQLAQRVTDISIPVYDSLHNPSTRNDHMSDVVEVLRAIFGACTRLEHISLSTYNAGSILPHLFHPNTLARPYEMALQVASNDNLDGLDWSPLTNVTRLHLIRFELSRPMLDFLHGFRHPAEEAEDEEGEERQRLGTHPLTHLRLSEVDSFAFDGLAEYIQTRETAMGRGDVDEAKSQSGPRRRARTSDDVHPRDLIAGRNQGATQEMLYNLATDADLFPDLRLVQIELSYLYALDPPSAPMQRESPTVTLSPRADSPTPSPAATLAAESSIAVSTGGHGAPFDQYSVSMPGQLATIDFPADVPLSATEAAEWEARAQQELAVEEQQRTAHRDAYWLQVRQGREALLTLFKQARAGKERGEEDAFDLRVVAPRPNGWSAPQMEAQFALTAFSTACRRARGSRVEEVSLHGGGGGGDGEGASKMGGCWEDEDIFELAERRPWLAIENGKAARFFEEEEEEGQGQGQGERQGDWDAITGYWTGELPRLNASSRR